MIADLNHEFDDEDPDEIADTLLEAYGVNLARSKLTRELEKIQRAGIDINHGARVLVTAHSASKSGPWISDIYGVGTIRACRLSEAGYSDIETIADADIDSLTEVRGVSRDYAQVFLEHAQELTGRKKSTVETLTSGTARSENQIRKDLGSLGASGVAPSEAKRFLLSQENQNEPILTDIDSVDARIGYFLLQSGFETLEDVASASVTELTDVRYIGDSNVHKIQNSAQEILSKEKKESHTPVSNSLQGPNNRNQLPTERHKHSPVSETVQSSYTVACFGGLTSFELVQEPDVGQEIADRIAAELTILDVDCLLYTGARAGGIDMVDMDLSTAIEATVELFSETEFDVPIGFVLGAYDSYGLPIEDIDTKPKKYAAYSSYHQTGFPELPDGLQYVPPDEVVRVGGLSVTQNPNLATDKTVLLTHERHKGQHNGRDHLLELSGSGVHGAYTNNKLNTIAVSLDLWPSNDVALGGYHVLTLDSDEVQTEELHRLGRVGQLECWDHTTHGQQYIHGPTECPYCTNTDVSGKTVDTSLLPNQRPTETTWASTLVASSQLEITTEDLNAYFSDHNVLRPTETTRADITAENTAERELDGEALETGLLQGEWILPCSAETVDQAWQWAQNLIAENDLYDARVDTKLRVALTETDKYHLLIAVPNYLDRNDVSRTKTVIQNSEIDSTDLHFKPLMYSKWRITSETRAAFGLDSVTRYEDLV